MVATTKKVFIVRLLTLVDFIRLALLAKNDRVRRGRKITKMALGCSKMYTRAVAQNMN